MIKINNRERQKNCQKDEVEEEEGVEGNGDRHMYNFKFLISSVR